MSPKEFVYWQAYASMEPIGDQRRDLSAAIIAQTVANAMRAKRSGGQGFKIADFLPNFTPRRRMNTPEAQKEFFRAMTLAVGGQVISRKQGGEV
jgi:hypothetical protein